MKKVIAITSCPTGVAHTYMAAENLEKAGEALGVDIKVETHGSVGIENQFTDQEIAQAEGLIIAADTNIEKDRFQGKQIIEVPVRGGIDRPKELIQNILDHKGRVYQGGSKEESVTEKDSNGHQNIVYRALMNGVSHMIPFVVTGGLLIALALTIGGQPTEAGFVIPDDSFWMQINNIGGAAMSFMGPILSAYIAYAIADRPGLVPGMVGGYIAVNEAFYAAETNTGFIGAIIAGFIAGYAALAVKKIPVPKAMNSVMPIIFIPIISTLIVGLLFVYVIGAPVAALFEGLTSWLAGLQGANMAILSAILGAMIAVDMGGPFNKTAFLFGVGLIADGQVNVMGAIAVAICIPPLATGLASLIFKNKFTEADQTAGIASLVMGFFGITEGAIPFAAKAPLRIIPSIVIGSSVGSIVAALFGVTDHVAHGGPIVAVLGAVDNVLMFFVAVIIGTLVATVLIGLLMPNNPTQLATPAGPVSGGGQAEEKSQFSADQDQGKPMANKENLNLVDLTEKDLIVMDVKSTDKLGTLNELLDLPALESHLKDKESVFEAFVERENQGSTGLGDGVGIPHAKSKDITAPRLVFARSEEGIDWDSLDDQPVLMVFMILVPEKYKGDLHLKILQLLARQLTHDEFKEKLMAAQSKDQVYNILSEVKS